VKVSAIAAMYAMFVVAKLSFLFTQRQNSGTPADEVLVALLLPLAAICLGKYWKSVKLGLACFIAYELLSLIGILFSPHGGVSQPLAGVVDSLLDAKIIVIFLAFYSMLRRARDPKIALRQVSFILIGLALINVPFLLLDLFSSGVGFRGQQLVARSGFWQPSGLYFDHVESSWVALLAFFGSAYLSVERQSLRYIALTVLLFAIVVIHFSIKETLVCAAAVVTYALFSKRRSHVVITFSVLPLFMAALFALTPIGNMVGAQFGRYTSAESSDYARIALSTTSVKIAVDQFPFGSGSGTFASAPSYRFGYSDVYRAYGIDGLNGISEDNPNYVTDVFWPKLLGQAGIFGLLAYALFLWSAYLPALKSHLSRRGPDATVALFVFSAGLVISLASTPFNHETFMIPLAFFMAYGKAVYDRRTAPIQRTGFVDSGQQP